MRDYMDAFRLPDGSLDADLLGAVLDAADIPPEKWRAAVDRAAERHGKSLDDLTIEWIKSGELSEADTRDAMEMLGTMPGSKFAAGVQ